MKNYKPGQIITYNNSKYRIIKLKDNDLAGITCHMCDLINYCWIIEKFQSYCVNKRQYLKLIK